MTADRHVYLSTACAHDECGSCRNVCKFCGSPCTHRCHSRQQHAPVSPVDDARNIARALLAAFGDDIEAHPDLAAQIRHDPALFWLRGKTQSAGEWEQEGEMS